MSDDLMRRALLIMLILTIIPSVNGGIGSIIQSSGCDSCSNTYETGPEYCPCPGYEECKDIFVKSTARYGAESVTDFCINKNTVSEAFIDCWGIDTVADTSITCPVGFICRDGRCMHPSGTEIGPAKDVKFDETGKITWVDYITIGGFRLDYAKDLTFANHNNTVLSAFLIETQGRRFYNVRNMTFWNNKYIYANEFRYRNENFYNAKNLRFNKKGDFYSADSITYLNNTFLNFKNMKVFYDGTVTIDELGSALLINPATGLVSIIENASSMKLYSNGDYHIGSAHLVSYGDIILVNVTDVSVYSSVISAKHADSAVIERTVLGNVDNLYIHGDEFSFDIADIVMVEELVFNDVKEGSFLVNDDTISVDITSNIDGNVFNLINPFSDDSEYIDAYADSNGRIKADFIRDLENKTVVSINVGDNVSLGVNQGEYPSLTIEPFTNESNLIKSNDDPATYFLTNGTITFENEFFTETVRSNNTASIEVTESGFGCMSILPIGVYYYIDKRDKRRDFAISIPDYGFLYRLCIRRFPEQEFYLECTNCGTIDFVDNKIVLKGVASYLRYGLIQENLAILNLGNVYTALTDPKTTIVYDNDLVYIDNFLIDIHSLDSTASLTVPSNYYMIIETPIDDIMHTLVKVNTYFGKDEITDNIIKRYQDLTITNNTLDYNNIMILPPKHELISTILS
jgi:hypothetical protein